MMNIVDLPRECRPQLGITADEILSNWKNRVENHSQFIRAFIVIGGHREFGWHDGLMVRIFSATHTCRATAEELNDIRLAIKLGNFLVLMYTDTGPRVLHQVGEPWTDSVSITPIIDRRLPIRYRAFLFLPSSLRQPCLRAIVHFLPKRDASLQKHSTFLYAALSRLFILLSIAFVVWIVCFLRTHNDMFSWLLSETTVPITALLVHRLRMGTFGTAYNIAIERRNA